MRSRRRSGRLGSARIAASIAGLVRWPVKMARTCVVVRFTLRAAADTVYPLEYSQSTLNFSACFLVFIVYIDRVLSERNNANISSRGYSVKDNLYFYE